MSILHSSRAPWCMLALFCIGIFTFFVLAAGKDIGLLPHAFLSTGNATLKGEVRGVIQRDEGYVVDGEHRVLRKIGQVLERAGQRLEGRGRSEGPARNATTTDASAPATPVVPRQSPPPQEADTPGKFLAHEFTLDDSGFQASFQTNRAVPRPKVFFIAAPARWVVDVPGTWRNMARFNNSMDKGFIRRVVLGEHDGYLRIVFHFRDTDQSHPAQPPLITPGNHGLDIVVPLPGQTSSPPPPSSTQKAQDKQAP
jgi:hypothetical protein